MGIDFITLMWDLPNASNITNIYKYTKSAETQTTWTKIMGNVYKCARSLHRPAWVDDALVDVASDLLFIRNQFVSACFRAGLMQQALPWKTRSIIIFSLRSANGNRFHAGVLLISNSLSLSLSIVISSWNCMVQYLVTCLKLDRLGETTSLTPLPFGEPYC